MVTDSITDVITLCSTLPQFCKLDGKTDGKKHILKQMVTDSKTDNIASSGNYPQHNSLGKKPDVFTFKSSSFDSDWI